MAISSHKITDAQISQHGICSAPDVLNGTPAQNKARFDQLIREAVKEDYNALIDALVAVTGAQEIGAAVEHLIGDNVQTILTNADSAINNRYTKAETDSEIATETNDLVESVTYNSSNGVFTITKKDGTETTIDTPIEKVPASFALVTHDNKTYLRVTNMDGTYTETDVSSLLNVYEFSNTTSIAFTVTTAASGTKTVTATVRAGSITQAMLASDVTSYLEGLVEDAEGYKNAAALSASAAAGSETNARNSATAAAGSATNAGNSATEAAGSATNAGNSATAAAGSATNAGNSATAAAGSATTAGTKAQDAEAWAVGKRGGVDVPSTDPAYHNNSLYWKNQAQEVVGEKVASFNGRSGVVTPQSGDYDASMVGADASGTASSAVSAHNSSSSAHSSLFANKVDKTSGSSSFTIGRDSNGIYVDY